METYPGDELAGISPESWLNIPTPLTDAMRILVKQVTNLQSRLTFIYAELTQTHSKVKELQTHSRDQGQLLHSLHTEHRDTTSKLQDSNSTCIKLTKEMLELMDINKQHTATALTNLQTQLQDAESFTKEVQKSVFTTFKRFESEQAAKLTQFRREAKGEIRSELMKEWKSLKEKVSDNELKANCDIEEVKKQLETFNKWKFEFDLTQEQRRRTENRNFENLQNEMEELKSHLEREIEGINRQFGTKIEEMERNLASKMEKMQKEAAPQVNFSQCGAEKVKNELEIVLNALKKDFLSLQTAQINHIKSQPQLLTPLWNEIYTAKEHLLEEIEAKAAILRKNIKQSSETLENRMVEVMNSSIESQLREIRAKLMVKSS